MSTNHAGWVARIVIVATIVLLGSWILTPARANRVVAAHSTTSSISVGPRALSVPVAGHARAVAAKKHCKKGYKLSHGKCKKKRRPIPAPTASPTLPVAYVAIGDSLTYGTGADHPSTQGYPALLAAHLPQGTSLLNLGVPGITMGGAVTSELPQALTAHAPLATVWLGTNDVLRGTCPTIPATCAAEVATFETGLDRMLSALQAAHMHVFVANLPDFHLVPLTAGGGPPFCVGGCWIPGTAINAAIVTVAARYGDPVIDVYAASKSLWGRPEFVADGLHLTTAGYAAVADLFYGVMHAQGALP